MLLSLLKPKEEMAEPREHICFNLWWGFFVCFLFVYFCFLVVVVGVFLGAFGSATNISEW